MKVFFLQVIFFFGFLISSNAQEVTINGTSGDRLLEWKDFKGAPDDNSSHAAYTYWNIHYGYAGVESHGDSTLLKDIKVSLSFDETKSWVKEGKSTDDLLKHEQGHFDIGRLCQLEILASIKTTIFDKTGYRSQMKEIFKNALEKYRGLGSKYDDETNHGLNKEKQEGWNKFLLTEKERLLKLNQ